MGGDLGSIWKGPASPTQPASWLDNTYILLNTVVILTLAGVGPHAWCLIAADWSCHIRQLNSGFSYW